MVEKEIRAYQGQYHTTGTITDKTSECQGLNPNLLGATVPIMVFTLVKPMAHCYSQCNSVRLLDVKSSRHFEVVVG